MCLTVLSGGTEELARCAVTARGGLEVLEDVLDEAGFGRHAVGAAHEIAAERGGVVPPDLESPAGRDNRVLLGLHRLMEEGRVGGGHVLHGGHDWWELRVILRDAATWKVLIRIVVTYIQCEKCAYRDQGTCGGLSLPKIRTSWCRSGRGYRSWQFRGG